MKIHTFSRTPGTSPLLFCLGMFFTALFVSVFACSAIYYAVHTDGGSTREIVKQPVVKQQPVLASIMK